MNEAQKPDPIVTAAMALKRMQENLPALLDMQRIQSRLVRERYTALLEAGFTQAEAMELCVKKVEL